MRSLSIFALLVSAASMASASTISLGCTQSVINGQSGNGNSTCTPFTTLPSGFEITNVVFQYAIDFQFNTFTSSTADITYLINLPGGATDPAGNITQAQRPLTGGSVVIGSGDWATFVAGAAFTTQSTGSAAVTGSTFDAQVTYTYEAIPQSGDIPEPSTLALVGGVLLLAGIRKFRS